MLNNEIIRAVNENMILIKLDT